MSSADLVIPSDPVTSDDADAEIGAEVAAVAALDSVPTILRVLCRISGMRFAAVTRVTAESWIACAVQDGLNLGLKAGSVLDVNTTLCIEARAIRAPIVISHASRDLRYCHSAKLRSVESYITVPITLTDGRYFGNLYALDSEPADLSDRRILLNFEDCARMLGSQISSELARVAAQKGLLDERASSELREQFIAILGHDLRNPLQAVLATGELLERKIADPKLAALATRIRSSARRMSHLIDDVLDFARGRLGGGFGLKIAEIENISEALNVVVKELQSSHAQRRIVATIDIACIVRCDIGRVQQIASNLIGNALTHGSTASPVKFTAVVENDSLLLSVWNDGVPIPRENLDKIFEPFWRPSTAGERQGLGLGLHICSQIVDAHGGTLSVTSTAAAGTEFRATLPLHPAHRHLPQAVSPQR